MITPNEITALRSTCGPYRGQFRSADAVLYLCDEIDRVRDELHRGWYVSAAVKRSGPSKERNKNQPSTNLTEPMTKENAKQLLPIIQAYAEGKEIQYLVCGDDEWKTLRGDPHFDQPADRYRIAPEKPAPPLWSKPEHVPLGARIRPSAGLDCRWLIVGCDSDAITAARAVISYSVLDCYEHSTDQGKTWKPCTVAEGSV